MDKNLNDINRLTWLYLLSCIDLDDYDYWYLRGMLDVILPEDNTAKFGNSPLIDYLYKIKVLNSDSNDVFCYEDNFANHRYKKGDYDGIKSKS